MVKSGRNVTRHSKKNLKTGLMNTHEQMIRQILQWIREGNTRLQIEDLAMEEWGMISSTARTNYYKALDLLVCSEPEDIKKEVSKLEEMYMDLYKGARERKDYNTARLVLENLSKLKGFAQEKIQHEVEIKIEF